MITSMIGIYLITLITGGLFSDVIISENRKQILLSVTHCSWIHQNGLHSRNNRHRPKIRQYIQSCQRTGTGRQGTLNSHIQNVYTLSIKMSNQSRSQNGRYITTASRISNFQTPILEVEAYAWFTLCFDWGILYARVIVGSERRKLLVYEEVLQNGIQLYLLWF